MTSHDENQRVVQSRKYGARHLDVFFSYVSHVFMGIQPTPPISVTPPWFRPCFWSRFTQKEAQNIGEWVSHASVCWIARQLLRRRGLVGAHLFKPIFVCFWWFIWVFWWYYMMFFFYQWFFGCCLMMPSARTREKPRSLHITGLCIVWPSAIRNQEVYMAKNRWCLHRTIAREREREKKSVCLFVLYRSWERQSQFEESLDAIHNLKIFFMGNRIPK